MIWLAWGWGCEGQTPDEPPEPVPVEAPEPVPVGPPQAPPAPRLTFSAAQLEETFEKCIEEDPSTLGMVTCTVEAEKAWDAELNRLYRELLDGVSGEDNAWRKDVLVRAERAWLRYRDAEHKTIETVYGQMQGTMYRPAAALARLELVRNRTRQLAGHLGLRVEGLPAPPDPALDTCLGAQGERLSCYQAALVRWDTELNRSYRQLRARWPAGADTVRDAQRAWIPFRDAELLAIEQFHTGEAAQAARVALTQARARELAGYASLFTEQ